MLQLHLFTKTMWASTFLQSKSIKLLAGTFPLVCFVHYFMNRIVCSFSSTPGSLQPLQIKMEYSVFYISIGMFRGGLMLWPQAWFDLLLFHQDKCPQFH